MHPATRRALIAATAAVGSTVAAVLTHTLLGLPPETHHTLASLVPGLFGLDAIAIVALLPALVVSTAVALAVSLECRRQLGDVRRRRHELEG
ncbi:hypothetical protein [Natronoglomus mannanivorans]|uniref:Uncharacterized protein n=1 Tax=Natronoglomus mannanivorans TaxID=2979990 RepID=A0AAP2Z432_9EURY|nr:hypothetical protein [Halobacteria archaeon AArc-xg1-1]